MAELSDKLLKFLEENGSLDSQEISNSLDIDHQKIVGAIKSLQSLEDVRKGKCFIIAHIMQYTDRLRIHKGSSSLFITQRDEACMCYV